MSWMIQVFKDDGLNKCWIARGRTAKSALAEAAKYKPILLPFLGRPLRRHRELKSSRRVSYTVDFKQWRIWIF